MKGYHECGFTVTVGEIFFLEKNIGSLIGNCGEAFRLVSCKGQLGQEKSIKPMTVNEN